MVKIAQQVEAHTLDGVADVRDESDREGVRLVVEVKRGFAPQVWWCVDKLVAWGAWWGLVLVRGGPGR